MAKPEWGAKRLCPQCGTRFYDLLRDPVDCPNCGATFALEALSERRGAQPARARAKPEKAAPAAAAAPAEDEDALIDDTAEEEDLATDDVLLDDDEDDDDGDLGEIGDVAKEGDDDDT